MFSAETRSSSCWSSRKLVHSNDLFLRHAQDETIEKIGKFLSTVDIFLANMDQTDT